MKRLVYFFVPFFSALFLFLAPFANAQGVYNAASPAYHDVNACINSDSAGGCSPGRHTAVNGDTIIIPAGSATWTSTIVVPAGLAITITGSGTPNNTPSTTGASASCSATVIQIGGGVAAFSASPAYGAPTMRLSCMAINWVSGATNTTVGFRALGTCTTSGCPSVRLDNITFNGWTGKYQINHLGDVFGVMDHNTVNGLGGGYTELVSVGHASFLGVGLWGDNSWAQPEMYGLSDFLFIENNLFRGSGCCEDEISAGGLQNEGGSRVVARFNTFNANDIFNFTLGWHGTETGGRPRSGRAYEYYKNTYNVPAQCTDGSTSYAECAGAIAVRGGTGLAWGNTINSAATAGFVGGLFQLNLLRANGPVNWGVCDGTNPIDGNDPSSNLSNPSFSGTITAFDATTGVVTVNGSPGWATNQWVPAGQAYSFHDVTTTAAAGGIQQGGEIQSNTANTFTIIPAANNVHQQNPNVGDSILITRALWCMDQGGGRGASIYQVGNATTHNASPPYEFVFSNEVLSPAYFWMNAYPNLVPSYIVGHDYQKIQPNRDWYIETPNQTAQSSATSPFNGTSGTGYGTLENRPTTCTPSVAYWATDQGSWNTSGSGGQGQLYLCTATNTWSLYYTPYTYPHPITAGGTTGTSGNPPSPPTGLKVTVQ